MSLFYFHLSDGRTVTHDRIGVYLPDLDAARDAAKTALSRHAIETTFDGNPYPDRTTIEICDGEGTVLQIEWCWCLIRQPTPYPPS